MNLSRLLALLACLAFLPVSVFAGAPAVIDLTAPKPGEDVQAPLHGTIRAGCAPWQDGQSVGIELENHLGAVIYMTLDNFKKNTGFTYKAGSDTMKDGGAVLYRCDEKDGDCSQVNGTLILNAVQGEDFNGILQIEDGKPQSFSVKRMPMKAPCLS